MDYGFLPIWDKNQHTNINNSYCRFLKCFYWVWVALILAQCLYAHLNSQHVETNPGPESMVCKQLWSLLHRWLQKKEWVDLISGHRHCKSLQEKGIWHKLTPEWRKNVRAVEWTQRIHLSHSSMCCHEKPPVPLSSHRWHWSHQSPAGSHLPCSQDGQGRLSIITGSISGLKCLFSCHQLGPRLVEINPLSLAKGLQVNQTMLVSLLQAPT